MTMCSGGSGRAIRLSMVGMKSSATVQQMQPLASSMFSAGQLSRDFRMSPSTPAVPNHSPPAALALRVLHQVTDQSLPAPRKPVMTVTGILFNVVMEMGLSGQPAQARWQACLGVIG